MAESTKLADILIGIKLDTRAYKQQINALKTGLPNNKQQITNLRSEIALQRTSMRLGQQYEKVVSGIAKTSMVAAVGLTAMVGKGITSWLNTTDPAARKFNSSLLKLKATAFNVFANIGKQAAQKWQIQEKLEKLIKFLQNLTLGDIDKFLNVVKIAILVAGFAKMAKYAFLIKDYFEMLSIKKLMAEVASVRAAGILGKVGGSVANGAGMAGGSAIGTFLGSLVGGTLYGNLTKTFRYFKNMGGIIGWLGSQISSFIANILSITGKLTGIKGISVPASSMSSLVPVMTQIGNLSKNLLGYFLIFTAGFRLLQNVFKVIGIPLKNIREAFSFVWEFLKEYASKLWSTIKLIGNMFEFLGNGIQYLVDVIYNAVKSLVTLNPKYILKALADDSGIKETWANAMKNATDIIDTKKFGKLETFTKLGSKSDIVGIADLNKAFQKLYEENAAQRALTDNTTATKENTNALNTLASKVNNISNGDNIYAAAAIANKTGGNVQDNTNAYGYSPFMNSNIGANKVAVANFNF